MIKIGISASFFHEDPKRAIFKGMTLQYIEQNVAHGLMQRDVLSFMIPSPDGRTRREDRSLTRKTSLSNCGGFASSPAARVWNWPIRPA